MQMHNSVTNNNSGEAIPSQEQARNIHDPSSVQIMSDLEKPDNVYTNISERRVVKKKKKKKVKRLRERS